MLSRGRSRLSPFVQALIARNRLRDQLRRALLAELPHKRGGAISPSPPPRRLMIDLAAAPSAMEQRASAWAYR